MKIKDIELKNNLILAPMADYTDVAFRSICKDMGAALTVTEMVSAKALMYDSEKTIELLETAKNEVPKAVQLFGSDPEIMALACNHPAIQKFDIIDINMGCPVPKIVKNGEGSALMQNMPLARQIIESCVKATNKPITVKFRTGWSDKTVNAVEFAKMCEEAGASMITIHGRTRDQFYAGLADYNIIRDVKKAVKIPVVGNGDVTDKKSYDYMMSYTGVDGVMIGRASVGNPWIFEELRGINKVKHKLATIKKQIKLLQEHGKTERQIVLSMRKHIAGYLKGEVNGNECKIKIFKAETLAEVLETLEQFFS
ncbi:MAG: tRNA dihydrouridine synthase DusB [Spirochaetales bacterium]